MTTYGWYWHRISVPDDLAPTMTVGRALAQPLFMVDKRRQKPADGRRVGQGKFFLLEEIDPEFVKK